MYSLLECFPYPTPRLVQEELLQKLEASWDSYDVFVITAPTATGKTAIAKSIMNWGYSVSTITPNNMLINQFLGEFNDTQKLKRMDLYWCNEWRQSCAATRGRMKGFCKGCECSQDLRQAKFRNGPGVYTYHMYVNLQLYRDVLVVDEAHNLPRIIADMDSRKLWQHDLKYPSSMYSYGAMRDWIAALSPRKQKLKGIELLKRAINDPVPKHVIKRTMADFNGKGTKRGEPELRDCIEFYALDPAPGMRRFIPPSVSKLILMSGTIDAIDVKELGIQNRRICYLDCKSPIPPPHRPIVPVNLTSVNRSNIVESCQEIADYINTVLLPRHEGEKGVIHVTYQMANLLSAHLTHPRYMLHDRTNKTSIYQEYRDSPASEGRVLVASGMYEGIDLPEDLGRWQVIAKAPWKSLGDPAIAYKAKHDEDWYQWQTLKDVIQASGRICRTPDDYGVTYLLDSSITNLLHTAERLVPEWFREAIVQESTI